MKEKKFSISNKLKHISRKHLLLAGLLGVLLLVIAMPVAPKEEKGEETGGNQEETSENIDSAGMDADSYRESLERQLEEMLAHMEGVGQAKVMITFKDGGESVVAKDYTRTEEQILEEDSQGAGKESRNSSFQEASLYVQQQGGENEPFVSKERMPKVEGVFVVAQGGGNGVVAKNISDAILALFDLEAHKIVVVKMN